MYHERNLFAVACLVAAPWSNAKRKDVARYPGRHKILGQIFEGRISYNGLENWRKGTRKPPQWARDTLAAHLEREAITRLEIAKQLRGTNEKAAP
jgi:hypothetical protein